MTVQRIQCERTDLVALYALSALSRSETRAMAAHVASCAQCRRELKLLRPIVDSFVSWPTNLLRPSGSLWDRLAQRIAAAPATEPTAEEAGERLPREWVEVAPGISCILLAGDGQRNRVSMLVRLEPGAAYPPHQHAGVEELHLLDGELWIENRKLHPGDYNRAPPGTDDRRVWSETGCTCVLTTSSLDVLR
jgi:anti-sigma factor ChrR (cupin superfamily)